MNHVSYTQRECKDKKKIDDFLLRVRIGVLGMASDDFPYVVPVNFVWHDGSIYFHGMGSGKKENILSKNPRVSFTVYEEYGTVTDPVPCHSDTSYMSVMLFGEAKKVTDCEEATAVLQKLVDKFMPEFYNNPLSSKMIEKYRSSLDGNAVSVYRMTVQEMTAKENSVDTEKMFKMGTR